MSESWLRNTLKAALPNFGHLLANSLFINLLALAPPVFMLQIYDRVIFHAGLSTLQGLSLGMCLAILFDLLLRMARSRLMQEVSLKIDGTLATRLYDKMAALPLATLEGRPASYWQSAFRDIEHVRNMFGGSTAVLAADLPFVMLFIALIAVIATPVVWVLFAALGAFAVLAALSSRTVHDASVAERAVAFSRDAVVGELVAARTTVKALSLAPHIRTYWEDRQARTMAAGVMRGRKADLYGNLAIALSLAVSVAMTIVGALAILDQKMTIGALIAANMLSMRVVQPLSQLVAAWNALAQFRDILKRLNEIFALPIEDAGHEIEFYRPAGNLVLEGISFAYGEDPPVIPQLHLTLKPGGFHAIVGRNGGGKSTLLKLMQGLYRPDQGRVLLDKADVKQFSRKQLAHWVGYVPQECILFAGTIRENIAICCPDASDAEILALSNELGLHDDIVDLPDGYNTDVGETGRRLSTGQRQKIVLARALLSDPPLLLLDEPTSNLDRQSTEKLANVLARRAKNRNVIVVTHSPLLLAASDNLVVLDKGRVKMAGPTNEVMSRMSPEGAINPSQNRLA